MLSESPIVSESAANKAKAHGLTAPIGGHFTIA